MKHLAILLSAVSLGSGCIVSSNTCDAPGTLFVDWSFVNKSGVGNLACNGGGLSASINDVDIYVDGTRVVVAEPCTTYTVGIAGLSAGRHDVIVEGFDAGRTIITRDIFWLEVCGDTAVAATPGEGTLKILPTTCEATPPDTYLLYSLVDVTRSPNYVISQITPTVGTKTTYTCAGGISFPVPWGYYDLTKIEEIDSTDSVTYASNCTTTPADVLGSGVTAKDVTLTAGGAACTW